MRPAVGEAGESGQKVLGAASGTAVGQDFQGQPAVFEKSELEFGEVSWSKSILSAT